MTRHLTVGYYPEVAYRDASGELDHGYPSIDIAIGWTPWDIDIEGVFVVDADHIPGFDDATARRLAEAYIQTQAGIEACQEVAAEDDAYMADTIADMRRDERMMGGY